MIYVSKFPERDLNDYVKGRINLTPIMNILMNDRRQNLYAQIGEYYYKTNGEKLDGKLAYFDDKMKFSIMDRIMKKDITMYETIAMFVLTDIDKNVLRKMFGDPHLHNEFGEGFSERNIKKKFASYFLNIDNVIFHLGYDHRGITIEVESDIESHQLLKRLKQIIDEIVKMK